MIKKRKILLYLSIIAFTLIASATLMYSQGYTLDKNFQITQRGGLYVFIPESDCDIFVDNEKEKTTGALQKGLFMSNMKTGSHTVLVDKPGYWPWGKNMEVNQGMVIEAKAILIPEQPKGDVLFKGKFSNLFASDKNDLLIIEEQKNEEFKLTFYIPKKDIFLTSKTQATDYWLSFKKISNIIYENDFVIFNSEKGSVKADFDFANNTVLANLMEESAEEISDFEKFDKKEEQKIWWSPQTNEVFVDWLNESKNIPYYIDKDENSESPVRIFQSRSQIKNIEFYPGRKDIVLMAIENGIYALEIDGKGGRLVYPVYKGKTPTFETTSDKENIYVLDAGSLIKIELR